jgi:hypothetical protein
MLGTSAPLLKDAWYRAPLTGLVIRPIFALCFMLPPP